MNSARRERSFSLTIRIIIRFSHTISLTIRIVFRFSHTITVTNIAKQSCQLTTLTTFSKFPPCLMNQTASQQVLSQRATPYQTFNPPTPPPLSLSYNCPCPRGHNEENLSWIESTNSQVAASGKSESKPLHGSLISSLHNPSVMYCLRIRGMIRRSWRQSITSNFKGKLPACIAY